jgi:flagellar operon protein (TIGR03826 family)
MALNIDYCPRCGKIFAKGIRDICPACVKTVEEEYERCVEYLRKNNGANIQELSEATEVSVKQITKFIREGRISLANAPNLMYPCEVCGILIREGLMCDRCRNRLRNDIRQAEELEQRRKEAEQRMRETLTYKSKEYELRVQQQQRDYKK